MAVGEIWKRSGWFYEAESATEVMRIVARLSTHGTNYRFAWRGLASADYELTSSIHRQLLKEGTPVSETSVRDREKEILDKARSWGLGVKNGVLQSDLQLLADLQHFEVPTRLIDVTSNPTTALWFACQQVGSQKSESGRLAKTGVLLAIDMPWYEEHPHDGKKRSVFSTVSGDSFTSSGFRPESGLEEALSLDNPFVVSSADPNVRLRAQEGYFIASRVPDTSNVPLTSLNAHVGSTNPDEIKDLFGQNVRARGFPRNVPYLAIFIKSQSKEKILKYLRNTYNRTAKTIFPDFAGFSKYGAW